MVVERSVIVDGGDVVVVVVAVVVVVVDCCYCRSMLSVLSLMTPLG